MIPADGLARRLLMLLTATVACGGCFATGPARVRVQNLTGTTAFCRVGTAGPGQDVYRHDEIAPGSVLDVDLPAGSRNVCVYSCNQSTGRDGIDTKVVGCQQMQLDAGRPVDIVVFDGPTPPATVALAPPGRLPPVVWENNVNPVFRETRSKTWLTPYGDVRPGMLHASIEHPGRCPKTVHLKSEDRKRFTDSLAIDPKETHIVLTQYAPVWISFGLEVTRRDLHRVWDLPAGEYRFRVRDDCTGIDLLEQRHPEGTTDAAKMVGERAAPR